VLVTAASFSDFVLAIHILAVVIAFGVTFSYPIFQAAGTRLDRRSIPWFYRMQEVISKRVINPGVLVILIAGIVLATDEHQWKHFYVQWGIAAVIALGALDGAVMRPLTRKLVAAADSDVERAGDGEITWSAEHEALIRRQGRIGTLMTLIVVVTVFFMALHL